MQEVDNLHSQIEQKLKVTDVYSPLGLLRVLKQVNTRKPLEVIQMRDFFDYKSTAKKFTFSDIPYTRVKIIRYSKQESNIAVEYGLSFDEPLIAVAYCSDRRRRGSVENSEKPVSFPEVRRQCPTTILSQEKLTDLKAMLKFMDEVDVKYYDTIISKSDSQKAGNGKSSTVARMKEPREEVTEGGRDASKARTAIQATSVEEVVVEKWKKDHINRGQVSTTESPALD